MTLIQGFSHSAAILEYAVRNGYTSITSNKCSWNEVFTRKVFTMHINFVDIYVQHLAAPVVKIDVALPAMEKAAQSIPECKKTVYSTIINKRRQSF